MESREVKKNSGIYSKVHIPGVWSNVVGFCCLLLVKYFVCSHFPLESQFY